MAWSVTAMAQRIILDLPTKAGELTLFPEVGEPNNFYFVADKAQLAVDDTGSPKFSFLRYVTNKKSTPGEADNSQGEGGGIVHAVVSLAVSDEQLEEARRALRRIKPEGEIIGPIIFKSGTFGLVTSFTDQNGELAKQVVGIGQAPILDGQQAAISMHLTRLGATLLWNSFQTSTPDISFSFMMTMDGYRLPKEAVIEADFESLYQSMEFGLKAGYVVETGSGSDGGGGGGGAGGRTPRNQPAGDNESGGAETPTPEETTETPEPETPTTEEGETEPTEPAEPTPPAEPTNTPTTEETTETSGTDNSSGTTGETVAAAAAPPSGGGSSSSTGGKAYFGAELHAQFEKLRKDGAIRITQIGSDAGMDELINLAYAKLSDIMFDRVASQSTNQMSPQQMASLLNRGGAANQTAAQPVSGVTFSFKMKQKRRTGTFRMDLNKWTTDELVMRFDENIGNLSRFLSNPRHFHQINTDDELYRQREVFAVVDGYNAADFAEYINFVTVRLKKEHANGDVTHDEVVIDRDKFSKKGNNFSMIYGWKGDGDREAWMNYEHEVLWSFFGDVEVAEPMKPSSFNAINLSPLYAKREVEFQADPTFLEDQEVRLVNVKLFYKMGGKEFFKAISLNPSRNQLSEKVLFVAPTDVGEYEYEVTWRLRGNRVVSSGRLTGSDNVLFVDELPSEE